MHPVETSPAARRAESWTRYWASGALHSCAGSFAGNYAGAIAAFWHTHFATLPPEAQVLDLCCGNAPLSKLLLESEQAGRVAAVVAIDMAEVTPPWLASVAIALASRMRVLGGQDATALPFADASFDLCMSQYGIEYAGRPAFVEAIRVLRPGGRLGAVIHHIDGLPVRIAHAECAHIDALLSEQGLYARAEAMIEPMARAATESGRILLRQDPVANAARAAFNRALEGVQARVSTGIYPDVLLEQRDALMRLIGEVPRIGAEAGHRLFGQLREALLSSRLRQQELVAYACDETTLRDWVLSTGEADLALAPLHFDNGELVGWGARVIRRFATR